MKHRAMYVTAWLLAAGIVCSKGGAAQGTIKVGVLHSLSGNMAISETSLLVLENNDSTSNTIASTRKLASESTAQCCICGPRVARLTLSTERTGGPWEFGGNGLRTRTDRR